MKHKKLLTLYDEVQCKKCVCTACDDDCNRISVRTGDVVSPCERCTEKKRRPFIFCVTFAGKKDSATGHLPIVRGAVQDDYKFPPKTGPSEAIEVIKALFKER